MLALSLSSRRISCTDIIRNRPENLAPMLRSVIRSASAFLSGLGDRTRRIRHGDQYKRICPDVWSAFARCEGRPAYDSSANAPSNISVVTKRRAILHGACSSRRHRIDVAVYHGPHGPARKSRNACIV